jgi:hypothetical protein
MEAVIDGDMYRCQEVLTGRVVRDPFGQRPANADVSC